MRWRHVIAGGALVGVVSFVIVGVVLPLDGTPEGQWGPFRGQVVDAQTGKPIAGAIFVAIWKRSLPTPVHSVQSFNDARVGVTDASGHFEIPRRWRPWFSGGIDPVVLVCGAPGYASFVGGGSNVTHDQDIHLAPLSPGERDPNVSWSVFVSGIPDRKRVELDKGINARRRELGLGSVDFRGVDLERGKR
jgi:hypothetical protein